LSRQISAELNKNHRYYPLGLIIGSKVFTQEKYIFYNRQTPCSNDGIHPERIISAKVAATLKTAHLATMKFALSFSNWWQKYIYPD
jgi:hypothetical protein